MFQVIRRCARIITDTFLREMISPQLLASCWFSPLMLAVCWVSPLLLAGCWVSPLLLAGCWVNPLLLAGCWVSPLLLAGCWVSSLAVKLASRNRPELFTDTEKFGVDPGTR
jgi:hypothetical protein